MLHYLERIASIQGVLVDQISILETMTGLIFLDFRNLLTPSSGFQSVQFRQIENRLGLRRGIVSLTTKRRTTGPLDAPDQPRALQSEQSPSLFDLVERWLARTPFVRYREFDFWKLYRHNVLEMLERDRQTIESEANLNEAAKKVQLAGLEQTREGFETVFESGPV